MFKNSILKMQNQTFTSTSSFSNTENVNTYLLRLVAPNEQQQNDIQTRLQEQGRTIGDNIVDRYGFLARRTNGEFNSRFVNVRDQYNNYTDAVITPLTNEQLQNPDGTEIIQLLTRFPTRPDDAIWGVDIVVTNQQLTEAFTNNPVTNDPETLRRLTAAIGNAALVAREQMLQDFGRAVDAQNFLPLNVGNEVFTIRRIFDLLPTNYLQNLVGVIEIPEFGAFGDRLLVNVLLLLRNLFLNLGLFHVFRLNLEVLLFFVNREIHSLLIERFVGTGFINNQLQYAVELFDIPFHTVNQWAANIIGERVAIQAFGNALNNIFPFAFLRGLRVYFRPLPIRWPIFLRPTSGIFRNICLWVENNFKKNKKK